MSSVGASRLPAEHATASLVNTHHTETQENSTQCQQERNERGFIIERFGRFFDLQVLHYSGDTMYCEPGIPPTMCYSQAEIDASKAARGPGATPISSYS
jgi:hypothetical protein